MSYSTPAVARGTVYELQHTSTMQCYTVKLVYNDTLGSTKKCCYNQAVVVTRTCSTETIESVPAMCVVVKRLML